MSLLVSLLALLAAGPQDPVTDGLDVVLRGEAPSRSRLALTDSAERLRRSTTEVQRALASHYPIEADRLGIDHSAVPEARETAWWTRFLNHQENLLDDLWTPDLDGMGRCSRDALLDRVRGESLLASALPRRRIDPVLHVEQAEYLFERARTSQGADREAKLQELLELVRGARRDLVSPRSGWSEEAMLRLRNLSLLLRTLGPDGLPQAAADACEAFRTWIEESGTNFRQPIPRLGRRNWEALIQAVSGTRRSVRELRVVLLREIARLDRANQELPGPTPGTLELEKSLSKAKAMAGFATNEARDSKVLPWLKHKLQVLPTPGRAYPVAGSGAVHRQTSSVVWIRLPDPAWPEPLQEAFERELDPFAVSAALIRYGMPGTGAVYARSAGEDSTPLTWSRSTVEGWGVYTADWLQRHPATREALGRQPRLRFELNRVQLVETALLLASLEWQTLNKSEGLVAGDLARRTGLGHPMAQILVRQLTHDPLTGIGALGAIELRDLEERLRRIGTPNPVQAVAATALHRPDLRPQDLITHGLAGPPGE